MRTKTEIGNVSLYLFWSLLKIPRFFSFTGNCKQKIWLKQPKAASALDFSYFQHVSKLVTHDIEKPSDCKALRPRSLGFLFAWSGQKRDFSGTVSLICCAVGIKRTAQASTPRPLYTIGLLVLSGAGQNNHDWQRQNKEDNHKAHPLPLWYHYACFL